MRPETDFNTVNRPKTKWLATNTPAKTGQFPKGNVPQEIVLEKPAVGRFVAVESLNAWDNKAYAAIAELDFYDATKKTISHDGWVIAHVTSEERGSEDGSAENAIDGQTANLWHTEWQKKSPGHPHRLVLDLGKQQTITGFRYVPRQSEGGGRIKDYNFYVGDKLIE
ncbi:MAG: discoidin domain-containing protein [bacterium]